MATTVRSAALALLGILLLCGCASGPGPLRAATASTAMVYGHLDLPEELQGEIQWVHIYNLGQVYVPPFTTPVVARFFPNGDFYAEGLSPGNYYVHHLVAGFEGFYLYPPDMSDAKSIIQERVVAVGPGEIAYLGSHRIHDWKPGISSRLSPQVGSVRLLPSTPGAGPEPLPNFMNQTSLMAAGAGTFSLEWSTRAADEGRVLSQILEDVGGSGWDARVESRLAVLR